MSALWPKLLDLAALYGLLLLFVFSPIILTAAVCLLMWIIGHGIDLFKKVRAIPVRKKLRKLFVWHLPNLFRDWVYKPLWYLLHGAAYLQVCIVIGFLRTLTDAAKPLTWIGLSLFVPVLASTHWKVFKPAELGALMAVGVGVLVLGVLGRAISKPEYPPEPVFGISREEGKRLEESKVMVDSRKRDFTGI